jgi:antitoxin component YwqK of YwqJK toxin-antitoxin module
VKKVLIISFVLLVGGSGFGQKFNYNISEDSTLFTTPIYYSDGSLKYEGEILYSSEDGNVISYMINEYYSHTEENDTTYKACNKNSSDREFYLKYKRYLKKETKYLNGVKNGSEITYWKQNEIDSCYEGDNEYLVKSHSSWFKGEIIGSIDYCGKNGKISKSEYYKDGKLRRTKTYALGKLKKTEWYKNGEIIKTKLK